MKNECYRLFRNYCSLSIAEVSKLTGIKKKRLIEIEQGEITPEIEECCKIAKLYNISAAVLEGTADDIFKSIVCEPFDSSFYSSGIVRNAAVEKFSSLTDAERMIVMLYRVAENRSEAFEIIWNILSPKEE